MNNNTRSSKLLIDEYPLMVSPTLAALIGLNEAIVIQQVHFWLDNPKSGVTAQGRRWVWNSYAEWRDQFPFWSDSTIKRVVKSCKKSGLLLVERLRSGDGDQTNYYSVDYDRLNSLLKRSADGECQSDTTPNGICQSDILDSVRLTQGGCQIDTMHSVRLTLCNKEQRTLTETSSENSFPPIAPQAVENEKGQEGRILSSGLEDGVPGGIAAGDGLREGGKNYLLQTEKRSEEQVVGAVMVSSGNTSAGGVVAAGGVAARPEAVVTAKNEVGGGIAAGENLVFPAGLSGSERQWAANAVCGLAFEQAQRVLDALAWKMANEKVDRPVGLLKWMVGQMQAGSFDAAAAEKWRAGLVKKEDVAKAQQTRVVVDLVNEIRGLERLVEYGCKDDLNVGRLAALKAEYGGLVGKPWGGEVQKPARQGFAGVSSVLSLLG